MSEASSKKPAEDGAEEEDEYTRIFKEQMVKLAADEAKRMVEDMMDYVWNLILFQS